ncbi:unnamed protein product [Spirodela intermedia]|uniref:Uncharacterized protein n=1 Tax=Spirodela intermedia TaxID=51605 RepID=A0A7I8JDQ4_SPIIN|nr:unnamed protein product [Spirodela intermedia]CAA6668286.1 unnamed protein product [Spirodela intermedia]
MCKLSGTPKDPNLKLGFCEEDSLVEKEQYQRLVSKLIYMNHLRPDITFVVAILSQFMHDPREPHLQVAYRVLACLKGTIGQGLLFKRNGRTSMKIYMDVDYACSVVDQRSTLGYCSLLGEI